MCTCKWDKELIKGMVEHEIECKLNKNKSINDINVIVRTNVKGENREKETMACLNRIDDSIDESDC